MNEGMIRNLVTRIKGGNPNPVAITKPSSYKPPVPSPAVKAAQATVDADYKARVKAGTPAARTERMKARIAAMKEEVQQIDEIGDTPSGLARLKTVQARAHNTMNKWSKNPKSGYSSTPPEVRKATKTSVRASNRINKDPTTGRPFAYASLRREEVEQIDEVAKWRTHPKAHDVDTDGSFLTKNSGDFDNLKARETYLSGAKTYINNKIKNAKNAGKQTQSYAKSAIKLYPQKEEVERIDEVNARHSFTAAQQVLTPRKKDILNASSKNPRAKAAAVKYARRVAKFSPDYSKKDVTSHLRSMRDEVNEGAEYIEERLKASDPTSKWISDFVHSDNPRFKGKTKKERNEGSKT